ncbi:MAG: hypothetical protein P1S60_04465 [Anaerolineae bacterium]|nr:hypothetical protein [Anaerolineae bacterium]
MGRNRPGRSSSTMRLRGAERLLFIVGAVVFLLGLFGGLKMMDISTDTVTYLLVLGGSMLLFVNLVVLF